MPSRSSNASRLHLELCKGIDRSFGLADAHRADLEFRNVRDRVDDANGAVVCRAVMGPVIRHKYRVRPDRLHYLRAHNDYSAAALHFHKIAIHDAEFLREPGMHFAPWLRILLHQASNAAGLRAGE